MKHWTDESLMAFVDGELGASERADLERAMAGDAELQARVAQMQAQRRRVEAAFAPVLAEAVPDRLAGLLAPAPATPAAPVVDLAAAREVRATARRAMPGWAAWGGMAASVVLGVVIGLQFAGGNSDIGLRGDKLVAGGAVDRALSGQLASASAGPVAVQLTFVDRSGAYCRTFSTGAIAGLACRENGQWTVQTVAATERAAEGTMRQAASSLPRAVLDAVDERIAGDALDAERERAARDQGWRR